MSPIILTDENNKVQLLVGAAGGTKIITSVALVRKTQKNQIFIAQTATNANCHLILDDYENIVV